MGLSMQKFKFSSDHASLLIVSSTNPLVTSMSIKLSDLVREFQLIYSSFDNTIRCAKIEAYQDDFKTME